MTMCSRHMRNMPVHYITIILPTNDLVHMLKYHMHTDAPFLTFGVHVYEGYSSLLVHLFVTTLLPAYVFATK